MSHEIHEADANLHTLHAERAALRLAAQTARRKCWWLARWPMARATKPARKRRGRGRPRWRCGRRPGGGWYNWNCGKGK